MYKQTKCARDILSLQDSEGKWGYFHTHFSDSPCPYTTESALRRLEVLGYTIKDDCIQRAVAYMSDCLSGIKQIPDKAEKNVDWSVFVSLMLAARIRRFTKDNPAANVIAQKWAGIVTLAFENHTYDHSKYTQAYRDTWGNLPRGGRLLDLSQFYIISVVNGYLDEKTEKSLLAYVINKPDGIYYTYENHIGTLPRDFADRDASRYLGCIELLAEYPTAKHELQFVARWLESHRNANGTWDMGARARDGIYFPLSGNWRTAALREADCTYRISRLLSKLLLP
jgi:hypothetical protein